ncbi:MAG TPA: right-handed parallel beta-helix repeat-containing protein [Patescibacteria group bacterium]|nr:right-handed parallel beta-helix repeat-containing protein [Patescibacteria group bacterium]
MRSYFSAYLAFGLIGALGSALGATFIVDERSPLSTDDDDGGTQQHPWKSISKAAQKAAGGDLVIIRDGTYRETVIVTNSGTAEKPIRLESAPGARVVLTGADRFTAWKHAEGDQPVYQIPWTRQFLGWSSHMTHPDDIYHRLVGRCEQVAIDNYLLRQVLEPHQMAPGTFCANASRQLLFVWDYANRDLNKLLVEASTRQELLRVEGSHVLVRGLRFRFAANMAQHGAIVLAGAYDVLEDCAAESMNSSGATFTGENQVVRRCVFRDNGQLGFGASGAHQLLFTDCVVENNNTKGFDRAWEAGGDKLVLCRNAVLQRSRFIRNRGNGIWFDIGNEDCIVRQCFIDGNEDSGIFDEISFGLQVQDNVITGNGFATTQGAWGAQAGIVLSSSPDSRVERNLIVGNREGFDLREQRRTTPRIGTRAEVLIWNHDELIAHNIIAFNRDAQVWGWFDTTDGRQWPAASKGHSDNPNTLSLEQLKIQFDNNVYFAGPGQGSFEWGVTWGLHKSYPTLDEFRSELKIDRGGSFIDPGFVDPLSQDYRLNKRAVEAVRKNYPHGVVVQPLLEGGN